MSEPQAATSPSTCGRCVAHVGREAARPCGTHGFLAWPLAEQGPLALLPHSWTVFEPPNFDYESLFGLRIMTPLRITNTIKL